MWENNLFHIFQVLVGRQEYLGNLNSNSRKHSRPSERKRLDLARLPRPLLRDSGLVPRHRNNKLAFSLKHSNKNRLVVQFLAHLLQVSPLLRLGHNHQTPVLDLEHSNKYISLIRV